MIFRRDRRPEESNNFWVSYADLMAGLLFVFILLIGAIVSKSVLLRTDLHEKEKRLEKTVATLEKREASLRKAQKELQEKEARLRRNKEALVKMQKELKIQEATILSGKGTIAKQSKTIEKQRKNLEAAREKIRLQEDEVRKLHLLLEELKLRLIEERNASRLYRLAAADLNRSVSAKEKKIRNLNSALEKSKSLITLNDKALKLRQKELEKLNRLLLARNAKIDELNRKIILLQNLEKESNTTLADKQKTLQKYVNRVIILSNKLTALEDELHLKDKKLTELLEALDRRKTEYDALVARLRKQRARIKTLTGIRLKVIAELKQTLGNRIAIDKKTGALRLSSKILFDRGSAELKEAAKQELRETFEKYIAALMNNRAIRPHLERIVIEGHTDSDGGYLYNLELSQKRALAVMNYLLSLPIAKKYDLKKYLVASGRAYMDPILRNGVEDKEASRRIEIKFRLKNREAMYEIERILDADQKRLF
ncbi:OmpA family protein [Nitratifractor sp.]